MPGTGSSNTQITAGVSAADLAATNGQLVFGPTNQIVLSGSALGPDMASADYTALLRGNPRDPASWWLIVDIDARTLQWHRTDSASTPPGRPAYRR